MTRPLRRRTWAAKKLANTVTSPTPSKTTPTEKLDPRRLELVPSASTSPIASVTVDSSDGAPTTAGAPVSGVGANDGPSAGASADGAEAAALGAGAAPVAAAGEPAGRFACGARVGEVLVADGPGAVAAAGKATAEAVLPEDVVPELAGLAAAGCTGAGAALDVLLGDDGAVGPAPAVDSGVWICVDGSGEGPVGDVPPDGGGTVVGVVTLYVTDAEPTISPSGWRITALM